MVPRESGFNTHWLSVTSGNRHNNYFIPDLCMIYEALKFNYNKILYYKNTETHNDMSAFKLFYSSITLININLLSLEKLQAYYPYSDVHY